jgi:hypothetical protein
MPAIESRFHFASMLFGAERLPIAIFCANWMLVFEDFVIPEPAPSLPKPISFALSVRTTGPLTDQPWVCVNSIAGDRLIPFGSDEPAFTCVAVSVDSSLSKGRLGACNGLKNHLSWLDL